MNKDIFADWKTNNFVVVTWLQDDLINKTGPLIVLTDVSYWLKYSYELKTWCEEHHAKMEGMTVELPDEHSLTMFCLKWTQ